jgi:hypothetical protein
VHQSHVASPEIISAHAKTWFAGVSGAKRLRQKYLNRRYRRLMPITGRIWECEVCHWRWMYVEGRCRRSVHAGIAGRGAGTGGWAGPVEPMPPVPQREAHHPACKRSMCWSLARPAEAQRTPDHRHHGSGRNMAKPSIVFASILLTIIGATLFFVNLPWVASGAQTRTNNIVGTAFGAIFLAAGITGFWMLRNRQ